MIPYLPPPPSTTLLGVRVSAFAVLLLSGFVAGYAVLLLRGRKAALAPPPDVERFAKITLVAALAGAHLWGVVDEHGAGVIADPSLLFSARSALPSAAGALAGGVAGLIFLRIRKLDIRAFADVVAYAFPFAWLFARAGCGLAHDHLGRPSTSWLAVRFPAGPRVDCGLLELLATPLLIALVVVLGRRERRPGVLAAALGVAYGALRFSLDFLRATDLPGSDPRHIGLTFAQWMCLPLVAACAWLARGPGAAPGVRVRPMNECS